MATPRNRLCTHQCDTLALCERYAPVETLPKRRRLHVIGVTAEAGISPRHIDGVWSGAPQAAQSRYVPVVNPSSVERQRQLVSVELRIVPRPRDGAYVDHPLDAVRVQKANEVFN